MLSVTVNAYERDPISPKAMHRLLWLRLSGMQIQLLKFLWGPWIQIHPGAHIVPLAEIKQEYEVDPVKDLIPVCANCHAMIHRRRPALALEEIRVGSAEKF